MKKPLKRRSLITIDSALDDLVRQRMVERGSTYSGEIGYLLKRGLQEVADPRAVDVAA